jgi:hypothetical protein
MNESMTQELLKRLDALAAKLGMAATAIWQMYVLQARIDGMECLAFSLLTMIAAFVCDKVALKEMKRPLSGLKKRDDYDLLVDADNHNYGYFMFGASAVFFGIACICSVNAADLLCNPGLAAFQRIISALKQ